MTFSELDQRYYPQGKTYTRDEIALIVASAAGSSAGAATTATDPGVKAAGVFYLAPNGPGTYSHFLDNTGTAITIPAAAANHAIVDARLVSAGAYWLVYWQDIPIANLANYLDKTSDLTYVRNAAGNLFNKLTDIITGSYIGSTGVITASASYAYTAISLADMGANTQIAISGILMKTGGDINKYYAFYNGATKLTFGIANTTTSIVLSIPAGATVLYFTVKTVSDPSTYADALMVNYGAAALPFAAYVKYVTAVAGNPIPNAAIVPYDKSLTYTKTEVDAKIPSTATVDTNKNRFNSVSNYANGFLVNSNANAGLTASSNWKIAWRIPVTAGETLTISGWNSSRNEMAFYSGAIPAAGSTPATGTANLVASGNSSTALGFGTKAAGILTFVVPATATYMIVNIASSSEDPSVFASFQVESGAGATAYAANTSAAVLVKQFGTQGLIGQALTDTTAKVYTPDSFLQKDLSVYNDFTLRTLTGTIELEYFFEGHRVKQILNPYVTQTIDTSTVLQIMDTWIDGVLVHHMVDEIAPYRVFDTTVGGNHGYVKTRCTVTGHDKTNADVGSIWSDGTKQFVLVNIYDANNIDISSRPDNLGLTGTTLTHVSGATHTGAFTPSVKTDGPMFPCFKNHKLQILADDKIIGTGQFLSVEKNVTIIESYDVLTKSSIMEWLITQVGTATKITQLDGTPTLGVSQAYVFTKFGGCTVYTDFLALDDVPAFQDIMFMMANKISGTYKTYVPKALPFTFETNNYTLSTPAVLTATFSSRMQFTPDRCDASGIMCDRLIQLRTDDSFGYAIGFLPVLSASPGTGAGTRRGNCTNKAMEISNAGYKTYLSCIDSSTKTSLAKGDYFSCVGYKNYFFIDAARSAKYVVRSNNGDYLYLDWHVFGLDRVQLPTFLQGKTFTVVEKSANVNVKTGATSSILFEVLNSASFGYAILKF